MTFKNYMSYNLFVAQFKLVRWSNDKFELGQTSKKSKLRENKQMQGGTHSDRGGWHFLVRVYLY